MAACSDSEQFRVNGSIEGKPTMNLRVGYYANGAYQSMITAAREGEFEFFGRSPQPALLEITDYDYRPVARLMVRDGETYEINVDPSDRYAVNITGSDVNSRWSSVLRDNKEALRADANAFVAGYVQQHPADMVSSLLLLTEFNSSRDAVLADSLLAMIAPAARPAALTEGYNYLLQRLVTSTAQGKVMPVKYFDRRDSLRTFRPSSSPYSLIAMSTQSRFRADSVVPALRRLNRIKDLQIVDFSLDADTSEWKRGTLPDSAAWKQGWGAGGIASMGIDRLGVPSLPFFVVCDSAGAQIYRGAAIGTAEIVVNSLIKTD